MANFNISPLRKLFAIGLLVLPALLPALSLAVKGPSGDEAVRAPHDAYRANDGARLARHGAALKGHVLAPYVDYWQLSLRLERAPAEDTRAFLEQYPNTFVAEQLRRDWLRVLGKREEWDLFQQELPLLVSVEPAVACYVLLARWRQNDESALAGLKRFWNEPRELPEGCVPLAEAAIASGRIGAPQVWERFRVLGEANLIGAAKRLLPYLARAESPDPRKVERAAGAPAQFLEQGGDLKTRAARELAILALTRLARADPQRAANLFSGKLQRAFAPEDQAYVWGQLATQAARRHLPEALVWFAAARGVSLNDEQLAWRTRIALRQQNWTEVHSAIEAMSPAGRGEPAWVYWLGRSHLAGGKSDEAKALFARIAGESNFYGRLAAEELGMAIRLPPSATAPTTEEIAEAAANPGLQRALALYRANLRLEGTREWNWSIRAMGDRTLLAAADLARRSEVWDRAINTADRTLVVHDYAVRYLAPYRDVLALEARSRSLEEHWVLGLVRQESRFITNARSSVGASGLMQLMPATARWVAHKFGVKEFSWARVTDVGVNARLGTAYLKHVLDDLDGDPVLAAVAYNAGPGRARRWRDARPLEGAIYAESIPFTETRDYVKKVMTNTLYYAALMGGTARTLKERLGVIGARPATERLAVLAADTLQ